MNDTVVLEYEVSGDDFTHAGEASGDVKRYLKKIGFSPETVRKAAICMYEGEINMFIHAGGGKATVSISPDKIIIELTDNGPGIADLDLAMKEGYSTAPDNIRSLGFGAGMGLPNMKKFSDKMDITTALKKGTKIVMTILVE